MNIINKSNGPKTKFENLKMKEEECIHDFHMNILEIANACTALEDATKLKVESIHENI